MQAGTLTRKQVEFTGKVRSQAEGGTPESRLPAVLSVAHAVRFCSGLFAQKLRQPGSAAAATTAVPGKRGRGWHARSPTRQRLQTGKQSRVVRPFRVSSARADRSAVGPRPSLGLARPSLGSIRQCTNMSAACNAIQPLPCGPLRSTARPPSKSGRGWQAPLSGERSAECLPGRDATPPSEARTQTWVALACRHCRRALPGHQGMALRAARACLPCHGLPKLKVDTRTNRGKQWLCDTSERLHDAGWEPTAGNPHPGKNLPLAQQWQPAVAMARSCTTLKPLPSPAQIQLAHAHPYLGGVARP